MFLTLLERSQNLSKIKRHFLMMTKSNYCVVSSIILKIIVLNKGVERV